MDIEKLDKKFDELGSSLGKKVGYEFRQKSTKRNMRAISKDQNKTIIPFGSIAAMAASALIIFALGIYIFMNYDKPPVGNQQVNNTSPQKTENIITETTAPVNQNTPKNIEFISKEMMTMGEAIVKYGLSESIYNDRMVYITIYYHKDGIMIDHGPYQSPPFTDDQKTIKNAMRYVITDAETGEFLGVEIRTRN